MDNTPNAADSTDIQPQVGEQQLVDMKVTDNTSKKTRQVDVDKANISILVQQTLEQLNAKSGSAETSSQLTEQQAAELILADPKVLNSVQAALENVMQSTDVEANNAKEVLKENTALLNTLLTNNQTSTNKDIATATGALDTQEIKMSDLAKSNHTLAEKIQSAVIPPEIVASGKAANEMQIEAQVSQSIELLNEPVLDKSLQGNTKIASDINLLLALPDHKLTKVLEHIAGRIIPSSSAPDAVNIEQDLAKQIVVPKAVDFAAATDNQSKEFISVLKSGIEEFKQQLAQGREPGLDLKSLITDALAKSNDSVVGKTSVNVQQISQSISQVLDFAQSINRAIEHHQEQTYSAVQRDAAQIQGEQSKSLQFNQFEAKFEKAVNITKPEGHQQLAEKVRWMVNTKNLVADIRLDPAELGSVHVKVAMSGESATVNFVVQSQHARDAMDNATPRLREMLAEKGIELGQSSVEQESKGQGDGELSQQGGHNQEFDSELELSEQTILQQPIVNGALGGIDYFV
jgi:flagellar hook-length control protein FliK